MAFRRISSQGVPLSTPFWCSSGILAASFVYALANIPQVAHSMVLLDGIGSYRFLAGKCESIVLVSKESVKAEYIANMCLPAFKSVSGMPLTNVTSALQLGY